MAQAMIVLSDSAFKLFIYLCLNADRATARFMGTQADLARNLNRSEAAVADCIQQMTENGVCLFETMPTTGLWNIEIADGYWPYVKSATASPSQVHLSDSEYFDGVKAIILARACIQTAFTEADRRFVSQLQRSGTQLEAVAKGVLLGTARRYVSLLNGTLHTPILSLRYFVGPIAEVALLSASPAYWAHLEQRVVQMEREWGGTMGRADTR